MHGVPRTRPPLTPEQETERKTKIQKYIRAKDAVLEKNKKQDVSKESYALTGALMEINPDFYTLFNYRRKILQHMMKHDPSLSASLCSTELSITTKSLLRNPKSYVAWSHREWIVSCGVVDMDAELKLCAQMLGMDARNFHVWNYRRFIVEHPLTRALSTAPTLTSELEFTTKQIAADFSNYSAWHYRTVVLDKIRMEQEDKLKKRDTEQLTQQMENITVDDTKTLPPYQTLIDKDFDLVKQAVWTDPEDQSAWLYHRWLLARIVAQGPNLPNLAISLGQWDQNLVPSSSSSSSSSSSLTSSTFTRELSMCRELHTVEPKCKWVLLTMTVLLAGLHAIQPDVAHVTEMKQIFEQLQALDPPRTNYYRHVHQQLLAGS